jgi:glyoxylase-like metal-dependent hydrolase (beta-lactamase superfamily II)
MSEAELIMRRFVGPPKENNIYVLISGDEAALVDVADCYEDIRNTLHEERVSLRYILVSHGHTSHIHSLFKVKSDMGGTICLHKSDADLLNEMDQRLHPDTFVKDNISLKLGHTTIKVLHTPGHTMGSLCFYVKDAGALFTGDTLFKGEFGRIRGPHSMGLMLRSLKRLNSVIPPKTIVYPGHGPMTTMSAEAWLDGLDNLS